MNKEELHRLKPHDLDIRVIKDVLGWVESRGGLWTHPQFPNDVRSLEHFPEWSRDLDSLFSLQAKFKWFRLSKNQRTQEGVLPVDYYCEIRDYPDDYEKNKVFYSSVGKSPNPAEAIVIAMLISLYKLGRIKRSRER